MQLSPQHYAHAWHRLLAQAGSKERAAVSKRMLKYLHRTNRLRWLPEILRRLGMLLERGQNAESVLVVSAREMSAAEADTLAAGVVGARAGSVTRRVESGLLGGVRIETANSRWDASLAATLKALQKRLTA